jgi:uncharacterized protein
LKLNQIPIEKLKEESSKRQQPYGSHGFEHTERVYNLCLHLGKALNADQTILLPAAILHDVCRGEENHAEAGAATAALTLRKFGFDENKIQRIQKVIISHSFSSGETPESLEAKILSDADKLDALGALGIYRTAAYSGEYPRPITDYITHFHKKLMKLDSLLHTSEAKKIATERKNFMMLYLTQLNRELKGEG